VTSEPDPKPRPRIRDTNATRRKVREDPSCRCCGRRGSDAHHVLFRSQGGDDVEDNIVTLCAECHGTLHRSAIDADRHHTRAEIGSRLTAAEIHYMVERLGEDPARVYLRRHYNVAANDRRYSEKPPRKRRVPKGIDNLHAISDL
jgi:hypothetical protein